MQMSNIKLFDDFKPHLVTPDNLPDDLPQRTRKALKEVSPNKIFFYDNKPLILYFKTTQNLTEEKIFKKYWNFSESPIIFIESSTDIEIYNGFSYTLENKNPAPEKLNTDNLSYLSLISGEYFKSDALTKSDKRLDTVLLKNIKYAREKLIYSLSVKSLKEKLSKINNTKDKKKKEKIFNSFMPDEDNDYKQIQHIANALLGRIIFIRYLIDRQIALFHNDKKQKISNDDLKNILSSKKNTYQFFNDLQSSDKGFNGDWFPIDTTEKDIVKEEHLHILKELISGTEMESGHRSLFDYYDFSIIPIEFISNVYEHFIGEEKQKQDGAYYTPTFLVDYVLKYTVDDYFKKNPNEYNCKVLDPACGSGIFLVETFRKLVSQYEKVTHSIADEETIKKLVKDNIFGIDYNKNALQISVFSLYLAMLDYQDPKDIENFKFPYLLASDKNADTPNFFENDFFDVNAPYNKIFKETKLDFIIGNPPYGRSTIKAKSFADMYRKEEKLSIGNNDIVQPFMVRVKDFSSTKTQIAFIVTSKVLYNLQTKDFRTKGFFNRFKVNHILELSSVRKQIFENADTPVSIIFYRHSTENSVLQNTIKYISMKPSPYFEKLKLLLISKSDFKKVSQAKLLEYDYLWKVLVYGSYLDFNLINRLQKNTILKRIEKKQYPKGMGIQATKGIYDISSYIGKPFIDIPRGKQSNKYITDFYIKKNLLTWDISKVHRKGESKLFKKYSVLIKRGVDTKTIRAKSAILYKEAVFKHTLTGVNIPTKQEAQLFLGLIGSSLFSYFNLEYASSIGIEREQLHDMEKLNAPYAENVNISNQINKIENLQREHFDTSSSNTLKYNNQYKILLNKLDETVLNSFNLTKEEHALINYANTIIIPWVIQKNYNVAFSKYTYKDNRIDEYVKIFTDHYSNIYKKTDLHFQVTISWSHYAIGIYFKTLTEKPEKTIVWEREENIENFLTLMQGKTLENLFIQKDIKGFESDGFYVVKPNEIKNWHTAIGYLDFYEFEDAIVRAGK